MTSPIRSILAADCGSSTTTVVLIEQVKGAYRLTATGQAPSTYGPPWDDITVGVHEAARHVEKTVGRSLLTPGGWPITPQNPARQGVDAFVVVSSAGPPLQVIVAGLIRDISLASARRAATTTYTEVTHFISLDNEGANLQHRLEARLQAIREGKPDVVLLTGGTDGGATLPVIELAQTIAAALHLLPDDEKPNVLYAGNQAIRPEIADILGSISGLASVNNVRPVLDVEDVIFVQAELEDLYLKRKMSKLPGFDKLSNWTPHPVLLTGKSLERLVAFLSVYHDLDVLGVTVGSRSTVAVSQMRGQPLHTTVRSDAGMGHSLTSLLKVVPIERFQRWLPFELSPEALYDKLLNKSLAPASLPTDEESLLIELAIAREVLRLTVRQNQQSLVNHRWNLIVGSGRPLTGMPQLAQAALVMIDGIEPWGITKLVLDQNGVSNMLGAIAAVAPAAAASVATQEAFLSLGTVVAPLGQGQVGQPALRVKLTLPEGEQVDRNILCGAIELIPLPPGQKASLEIRPTRHFDLGVGQPGRSVVAEVEGGALGLIIDTRGRPLRLPREDAHRQSLLQEWGTALNIPYAASDNHY